MTPEGQSETIAEMSMVCKNYGGFPALRDVSLAIRSGDIVGLIGLNGAGKTTLLKLLVGISTPSRGSVTLLGTNPMNASPRVAAQIGVCFDFEGVADEYTALQYLKFSSKVRSLEWDYVRAIDLLRSFNMDNSKDKKLKSMSRGMTQKIYLIQALLGHPKLIVLDEPFRNLDIVTTKVLNRELKERVKSDDASVVVSSHELKLVEELVNRIAYLNKGELVKDYTLESKQLPIKLVVTVDGAIEALVKRLYGSSNVVESSIVDSHSADITVKDSDRGSKEIMNACVALNFVLRELRREKLSLMFNE